MPATIPPGNAIVGSGNPPVDMDDVAAVLAQLTGQALGSTLPAGFAVMTAVYPSGDVTGVTDAANLTTAIAALPASGGLVMLIPAAAWYIKCGNLVIARSGVYLYAPGTRINAVSTGDVIRMYDTVNSWPVTGYGGGVLGYPVIDGTSAGAGSAGVHMGDLLQSQCEVSVQNFTGAGSIGVHFDNAHYWTEQMRARVYVNNCTTGVVFDVTGATTSTNSFARADVQIYVNQVTPSYNGVTFQNGALIYDGAFALRGNFNGFSSALTSAVLTITGTVPVGHPGAGGGSAIAQSRVDIGAEVGVYADYPATIVWGGGSNLIVNCYGVIDFAGGPGVFAASSASANLFPFSGPVLGDATLAAASGAGGAQKFSGTKTYTGPVILDGSGYNLLVASSDGTATSAGAMVLYENGGTSFIGVYATSNSLYYGICGQIPGPAGTSVLGGYFKGLGVSGATNATATPIFGVLTSTQSGQGVGATAFGVTDSNVATTFHNVLDNGTTGGATTAGLSVFNGGTSTSGSAPVLTPTFANGTAAQLTDTSRDYQVYLQFGAAGTALTLAIGPTSTPANTVISGALVTAGEVINFRLPAGWYAQVSFTTTTLTHQSAVGC